MSVQVTTAAGHDMVCTTFDEGRTARYERIDDGSRFAHSYPNLRPEVLIVKDAAGRILASFPRRDVLAIYAPLDL